MEWKSLVAGLVLVLGMYAIKFGVGLASGFSTESPSRRRLALAASTAAYTLLFLISSVFLTRVDLLKQLLVMQQVAKWAMTMHWVMASLLLTWGIHLLSRRGSDHMATRAWILYAMPCPVCSGVILLTTASLLGFFPEHGTFAVFMAWALFMGLAVVAFLLSRYAGGIVAPAHLLGLMMVLSSLWFLLSVLVVPHVSELPELYALAGKTPDVSASAWLVLPLLLFGAGVCLDRFDLNMKPKKRC